MSNVLDKIPNYGLVNGWLGSEIVKRLLSFVQLNEYFFVDSVVALQGRELVDPTRRISRKLSTLGEFESLLRKELENLLPVVFDKLGQKPFVPNNIEVELVAHGDGAFFARHTDTITRLDHKGRSRVISAVYYFHGSPKGFNGGNLRIHSLGASGRDGTFVDISPDCDTLVCFPSIFPHEVLPIECASRQFRDSRFAINFWIHANKGQKSVD